MPLGRGNMKWELFPAFIGGFSPCQALSKNDRVSLLALVPRFLTSAVSGCSLQEVLLQGLRWRPGRQIHQGPKPFFPPLYIHQERQLLGH